MIFYIHSMRNLLATLIFLCLLTNTFSQNTIGLPRINNYSKVDFKGGTQTWDIAQDKNGRMVFANNEGLLTYDGTFWNNYPLPNRTIVRSVAISANGSIFVGGQGEIGFFEADNRGFLQFKSLISLIPPADRNFADIWDIEFWGESVFFRALDRIMEYRNNTIRIIRPNTEWTFLKSLGKKLIAQDPLKGLFLYQDNLWLPISNNDWLKNETLAGIIPLKGDSLLLVTQQKRVAVLSANKITPLENFIKTPINSDIFKCTEVNEKEFVLGTTADGCWIFNKNGQLIQKISRPEGLQNNAVLSVFLDREQNIWTGLNNGISFIAYNAAIKYINPNAENELSGFSVTIKNNGLYIGTSDGAYWTQLPKLEEDFSFSKVYFSKIPNTSGQVWKLSEVNQQILMGHNAGAYVMDGSGAKQITPTGSWLFLPKSNVLPSEQVLVGTYTGLDMFSFQNNQWKPMGKLEGTYESFRFLAIDHDSTLWASHPYRGIYKIKLSADQKKYSTTLLTEKNGLPSSLDNHVFEIKNKVVFATSKGAYEFDPTSNQFIPSPFLKEALGEMPLRYLHEDEDGNIWFCTGKKLGLVRFQKNGKSPQLIFFPEITGQILSGFESVYPYNRSNIFIASEKGIIHLNLNKYNLRQPNLSVVLGSVKASGQTDTVLFGGFLSSSSSNLSIPKLSAQTKSFHFEFSAPAYGIQNTIEYSYMLEGFDKTWSKWSNKSEKDYTNLMNGKYTFMVKVRDNFGNESTPITYQFYIAAPWYRTYWAYTCYLLFFIAALSAFYRFQKNKLKIQQIKFEEQQKQIAILHQLELEKNEKEIIKLQNEKLANEVMYKNKELADTTMHLVEKNDALLKVKESLQKLYKNTSENHDIKKTLHLIHDIEKNDANWEKFASHFDEVNNNFLIKLKSSFPKLTNNDLKVCAYLQLKLSSKEIAQMMNITVRGVEISRYRLRKKLNITTDQSLTDYLDDISNNVS